MIVNSPPAGTEFYDATLFYCLFLNTLYFEQRDNTYAG